MSEYERITRHLRKTDRMKEKTCSKQTLGDIGEAKNKLVGIFKKI